MPSKSTIVKKYGPYYHITSLKNWKSIQKNGLQPKDFGIGYSELAPRKDPLICLTAEHKKSKWLEQICDYSEDKTVVRIKIPSDCIILKEFDLDYTSTETEYFLRKCFDFEFVIQNSGDIACFEPIKACEFIDFKIINCKEIID